MKLGKAIKPQIQGMEPRRGRLGARTLPWNCHEKRRIKGVWWCLDVFGRCLGEKLERGERKFAQKLPKIFFFFLLQNEGSRDIYTGKVTLKLLAHLVGPPATLLTSAVSAFSCSSFWRIFEGLPMLEKHMFASYTKLTQWKINGSTSFAIDNMYYVNFRI